MAKLKHMFKKTAVLFRDREDRNQEKKEPSAPEGLWLKCPKCGEVVYRDDVKAHGYVCPKCEGYFRIGTRTRIRMVADTGTFQEWFTDLETENPLEYPGYEEKIANLQEKTKLHEAVTVGKCMVNGLETVLGVCDARFLMGSMGYVVGEKITRAFERATEEKLPVVLFTSSGGARMQEGIVSLMQMAKTSAAIRKHSEAGLFYLPVLTDPTTGGVTASFAMLGDVILAEPGALIGFAGPRVIAQTIGQKLPEGFQRAEFLVEKGIIDGVVERQELKETVWKLLNIHQDALKYIHYGDTQNVENLPEIRNSCGKAAGCDKKELTAWERVEISRSKERPTTLSYVQQVFDDFLELHGDRAFRDCHVWRTAGDGDRAAEGKECKGNHLPKLRYGVSGWLSDSASSDEAGRKIRSAGSYLCGYTGSGLRHRGRRTGTGRSHRQKSAGDVRNPDTNGQHSDRRRRQWWCAGTGSDG